MARMTIDDARRLSTEQRAELGERIIRWCEQNDATNEMAHDIRTLALLACHDAILAVKQQAEVDAEKERTPPVEVVPPKKAK